MMEGIKVMEENKAKRTKQAHKGEDKGEGPRHKVDLSRSGNQGDSARRIKILGVVEVSAMEQQTDEQQTRCRGLMSVNDECSPGRREDKNTGRA